MLYNFKSYVVDYDYCFNDKKNTVIFLHGWGGNKHSFELLKKYLINSHNILSISMPPYFLSKNIKDKSVLSLTIFDYADMIENLIKLHSIETIDIVCHSFGFRVTLILASRIKLKSLIVTGGAGIKFERNFINQIKFDHTLLLNRTHHLPLKKINGDYSLLSNNVDKATFKNIVNTDLKFFIKNIDCPTLLFWGKNDKDTPIKIFKYLKNNLKNCEHSIVKSGHFAYLDCHSKFVNLSLNFLRRNL